jgi:hypothetical protein
MDEEKCGNCRFYLHTENGSGACRAHPPMLFFMQQPPHPSPLEIGGKRVMTAAQAQFVSQFPPMKSEGWCGEYEGVGA